MPVTGFVIVLILLLLALYLKSVNLNAIKDSCSAYIIFRFCVKVGLGNIYSNNSSTLE